MRISHSFVPTLKEIPAEAQVPSHQLLVRAGFIRQLAAGIYSILPLAQRSLLKITEIVREEMNAIGAQEFYLPALNPREVWEESGRWTVMGETKFRDEPRPKSGLLRVRQFTMKDSYSFDLDDAGLDASFEKHRQAYVKIF